MAYRSAANGCLEIESQHVETVCRILDRRAIKYRREGNWITIDHKEKAATAGTTRPTEAFEELAPYVGKPQSLRVYNELLGETEVGFVGGEVRTDMAEKVWSSLESAKPTPEGLIDALRERGISARVSAVHGRRKSGRRTRFEIEPGSGGPSCRITIMKRFWDTYDLLSVPDVYQGLCRKYHLSPDELRKALTDASFGVEVRYPALGGPSVELLYQNLLEIVEEQTDGIRTELG